MHRELERYRRAGDSGAARGTSPVAASGHEPFPVSAGNRLVLPPVSVGAVGGAVDALAQLQIDLVGAHAKKQAELAQLRHLRGPSAALPKVDRLGLNADFERQLELRPPLFGSQCPDRFHATRLQWLAETIT